MIMAVLRLSWWIEGIACIYHDGDDDDRGMSWMCVARVIDD
jgi:hypothetical protein